MMNVRFRSIVLPIDQYPNAKYKKNKIIFFSPSLKCYKTIFDKKILPHPEYFCQVFSTKIFRISNCYTFKLIFLKLKPPCVFTRWSYSNPYSVISIFIPDLKTTSNLSSKTIIRSINLLTSSSL